MADIDWDKVLPLQVDHYFARRQRDADMERVKPLVVALQQIVARGYFAPAELASAVLRAVGVLSEIPEIKP